jgi:hypothetical protein
MTRKAWTGFVVLVGLGLAVLLCTTNSFAPGLTDLKDPLGRPSALSKEVIHSASEFDRITATLVPKHDDLSQRVTTLTLVSDNLGTLVGDAGGLSTSSTEVNDGTRRVRQVAKPLPPLIASVTSRAVEATPVVGRLGNAVGGVTIQLRAIEGGLGSIYTNLAQLGPRATTISGLLVQIQGDSERVRALGPLTSLIAQVLNSTNLSDSLTLPDLLSGIFGRTTTN